MSTNYYLRNKEEYNNHSTIMQQRNKIIEGIMKQLEEWNIYGENLYDIQYRIENVANVGYEDIHIGKRSSGWKPLFQKQEQFSSVRELKQFYLNNSDKYEIVNEYGVIYTWEDLEEELINWNGQRENCDRSDSYKDSDGFPWVKVVLYQYFIY